MYNANSPFADSRRRSEKGQRQKRMLQEQRGMIFEGWSSFGSFEAHNVQSHHHPILVEPEFASWDIGTFFQTLHTLIHLLTPVTPQKLHGIRVHLQETETISTVLWYFPREGTQSSRNRVTASSRTLEYLCHHMRTYSRIQQLYTSTPKHQGCLCLHQRQALSLSKPTTHV